MDFSIAPLHIIPFFPLSRKSVNISITTMCHTVAYMTCLRVRNLLLLHNYDNQQVKIHPQSRKLVSAPEAMSAWLRKRLHKGE